MSTDSDSILQNDKNESTTPQLTSEEPKDSKDYLKLRDEDKKQFDKLDNQISELKAAQSSIKNKLKIGLPSIFGGSIAVAILLVIADYLFGGPFEFIAFFVSAIGILTTIVWYVIFQTQLITTNQSLEIEERRMKTITNLNFGIDRSGDQQPVTYFDNLVKINVVNLSDYYGLVKIHTDNSFKVSITVGVIGFVLIAFGLGISFTNNPNSETIAFISTGAGIITEFISSVFFYLYNRTTRQLKEYHDSLLAVQNILLSFKIVGDIEDVNKKTEMMGTMLNFLIGKQNKPIKNGDSGIVFPKE